MLYKIFLTFRIQNKRKFNMNSIRRPLKELSQNEQNVKRPRSKKLSTPIDIKPQPYFKKNQKKQTKKENKPTQQISKPNPEKQEKQPSIFQDFLKPGDQNGFYLNRLPSRIKSSAIKANNSMEQIVRTPSSNSSGSDYIGNDFINTSKIITINDHSYLKIQKIGKGGSSKVYKVLSPDGSVYALKIVDLSKASPEAIESFVNEIHLLKMLQGSERIIDLKDSCVDKEKKIISIVLELGDIDLRSLIEKNRTDDKAVNPNFLRLMWQQMLEAVQIVHKANVVHSDLKPANFLFVKGTLKLIDFGIAKTIDIDADTTNIERTKQVGTLNYMSPEALQKNEVKGTFKCGRPADVWSLGCILYQLVYNQPPFPQPDFFTKISAIVDPDYEIDFPILDDRPDFADLLDVMIKCLQRDPKKRPTIEELLDHKYITGDKSVIENIVSNKLLSFINFIQDYEYNVGENENRDNYYMTEFAKIFLDNSKNAPDVDEIVIKMGEEYSKQ